MREGAAYRKDLATRGQARSELDRWAPMSPRDDRTDKRERLCSRVRPQTRRRARYIIVSGQPPTEHSIMAVETPESLIAAFCRSNPRFVWPSGAMGGSNIAPLVGFARKNRGFPIKN